jgi:hypothetical protein
VLSSGPVPDPVEVATANGELYGHSGMLVRVPGPLEVTRTGAHPWSGWTPGSGPLRLITLVSEPTDVSVGTTFSRSRAP